MNKKKGIIIAAAAAAVLAAVVLLLVFLPKGGSSDENSATLDEGAEMSLSVDKNGMHQASVKLNSEGKPETNGYGTLVEYYPDQIKQIHLENSKGSLDVMVQARDGESTLYTVSGYEDLDLQGGNPETIGSAAASLKFTQIASVDKEKSGDFGFEKPRSVVTVTYTDGTKALITIGNDAPKQAGTYVKFGTGDEIYVVDTETVEPFDYGVTDLVSLTINEATGGTEDSEPVSLTLSGAAFEKDIVLEPNKNENYSASYLMTAPVSRFANEYESSRVAGGVRGLLADSVKMVNPSDSQLSQLGLSSPNIRLKAVYPDKTVELSASKPGSDGKVDIMIGGKNVVYTISAAKVPWVNTSYEKLCYEYALLPKLTKLSGLSVKADGKTYDFTLDSRESKTTDNNGVETSKTITSIFLGDAEIQEGTFGEFYDKLSLIALADSKSGSSGGKEVLSAKYTYADGTSDSVAFTDEGGDAYAVVLNGEMIGHAAKAEVKRAVSGAAEAVK